MVYTGGCHCGQISYEIEGELDSVMECNCSICSKRGYLLWFVPREMLKLKTLESNISTYLFNKKHVKHQFCSNCGSGVFGEGINPKDGKMIAAVNVRCLEGVDIAALKKNSFDGRSL